MALLLCRRYLARESPDRTGDISGIAQWGGSVTGYKQEVRDKGAVFCLRCWLPLLPTH